MDMEQWSYFRSNTQHFNTYVYYMFTWIQMGVFMKSALPFLKFHNSLQFTSFNFSLIHYNKHLINAQRKRYLKISSVYKLLLTSSNARDFYSLITRWSWLPFSTMVVFSSFTFVFFKTFRPLA